MRAITVAARHELIGLYGVVERNWYLVKRYAWWELAFFVWTIANTLSIVFISKAVGGLSPAAENQLTTQLLTGMGLFAIAYGIVRASLVFGAVAAFFSLHMPHANVGTALLLLGVASV